MILGIDIGGTTINLGLVDKKEVVKKVTVPSFEKYATQSQTLDYLGDRIAEFLVPGVEKIGIGVPSVTDPVKGIVYDAVNIPSWDVVPLKEVLEKRFGIPVFVNNDANCYAVGAAALVKQPAHVVVTVTLGTGTGVGIVSDGVLFAGTHCGAGEIGALPYLDSDYESYCSKKFFTRQGLGGKEVSMAAAAGDAKALAVMQEFGTHLGAFLAVVMYAYDPDCIVMGGGIAHSFPYFIDALWASLRQRFPYAKPLEDLRIEAMPNEDVALVGSASL